MSFSNRVKNEAAKVKIDRSCCVIAELAGFVRMNGHITLRQGGPEIRFVTENASVARRIFTFIKRFYSDDVSAYVSKNSALKKNNNYNIVLEDVNQGKVLLYDTGFITNDNYFSPNYELPKEIYRSTCCKRAYIRGSFLGGGSVTNPERGYHLEMILKNEAHYKSMIDVMSHFGLKPGMTMRKESPILYFKEADQISDFLAVIDANKGVLDFENIRVVKDMRNHVNRLVNCETANLEKTVKASVRQAENIKLIEEEIGLKNLPSELEEVARLRLANMEASFKTLGQMANPPVGKSGINHRFKKIEEIANNLRSVEK